MPEETQLSIDASSLAASGDEMLSGMQTRLNALTQPEIQRKGFFGNIKEKFKGTSSASSTNPDNKNPNSNFREIKDKLGQARDKAGQMGEKVIMSAKELKEKLQNLQKSPFHKAIEIAVVDFVKKDLPGTIDKLIKEENFKKIFILAGSKIAANTATKWALYKTQETAGKIWEKKYDIATGAVVGAGLRAVFITAGAEAYIAKAVVSGLVASGRRGWAELENYDKPETLRARANIIKRFKELPSERKRQLGKKVLYAGVAGAAGSLIGMELMEHTGLGNYLHQAMASGFEKAGEFAAGIGTAISEVKEHLPQPPGIDLSQTATQVPNEPGMFNAGTTAEDLPSTNTPVPSSTPVPEFVSSAPSVPGEVNASITAPEAVMPPQMPEMPQAEDVPPLEPPSTLPEATPEVIPQAVPVVDTIQIEPVSIIDEAIKNIPPTMPLEAGSTPWSAAEFLLKSANPDGSFTPGDIMKVDQELCRINGIAVPEWGIEGKILATRIPAGFILKTDDENLLNIVKQVASSK